jgi:hypothetical protein
MPVAGFRSSMRLAYDAHSVASSRAQSHAPAPVRRDGALPAGETPAVPNSATPSGPPPSRRLGRRRLAAVVCQERNERRSARRPRGGLDHTEMQPFGLFSGTQPRAVKRLIRKRVSNHRPHDSGTPVPAGSQRTGRPGCRASTRPARLSTRPMPPIFDNIDQQLRSALRDALAVFECPKADGVRTKTL